AFWDLVCADDDWLRAEFDAIIAAGYSGADPGRDGRAVAPVPPPSGGRPGRTAPLGVAIRSQSRGLTVLPSGRPRGPPPDRGASLPDGPPEDLLGDELRLPLRQPVASLHLHEPVVTGHVLPRSLGSVAAEEGVAAPPDVGRRHRDLTVPCPPRQKAPRGPQRRPVPVARPPHVARLTQLLGILTRLGRPHPAAHPAPATD